MDDSEPEYVEEVLMSLTEYQKHSSGLVALPKRQTMRFRGFVGKQEILILLDSGSVATFVSEQLVSQCALTTLPCEPMTFTTADGSPMQSNSMVPQLTWLLQGQTFSYDTSAALEML